MKTSEFNDMVLKMLDEVRFEDLPAQPYDFALYVEAVLLVLAKVIGGEVGFELGQRLDVNFGISNPLRSSDYIEWFIAMWEGCPLSELYDIVFEDATRILVHFEAPDESEFDMN